MKRICILLCLILFITAFAQEAASKAESSQSELKKQKLAYVKKQFYPPDWIIGTWSDGSLIEFEFQECDVLSVFGSYKNSFKSVYDPYLVDSDSNDSEYYFTVDVEGYVQTYRFVKRTDNTLDYYLKSQDYESSPLVLQKK